MNNFIGTTISHQRFTFSKKSAEFVAEASDLHGLDTFLARLYGDSGEQGFRMVSKTNRTVDFVLVGEVRDAEGELQYWEFKPSAADLAFDRNIADITCIILND